MKSKKYLKLVVSLLCLLLVFIAAVNIVIDPLFQYHKPFFGMQPVVTNERYQNAGIAKNFDFDNAIIGNSMSENFRPSGVSRVFGGTTVKLVASGSHPLDWVYFLKLLSERKNSHMNLLFNIDDYIFKASTTELKHEIPAYLYDNNIFNDVNYWFNFSIFKKFTLQAVKLNLRNQIPDYEEAFMWGGNVGKEYVLKDYVRADISDEEADTKDAVQLALENIDLLVPYIEQMKETQFVFFFSPFSILAYDEMIRARRLDAFEESCIAVCEKLMKYENVCLYFFNNKKFNNIICSLDFYRDSGHYSKDISEEILCAIENKTGLLTKDNYKYEISDFFDFVRNYDYESIFN